MQLCPPTTVCQVSPSPKGGSRAHPSTLQFSKLVFTTNQTLAIVRWQREALKQHLDSWPL